jgi:DNA primase
MNPSFTVDEDNNAFKCYAGGCRAFGGPAALVQRVLGVDFYGAKDWLRDNYGTPAGAPGSVPRRAAVGPKVRRSVLDRRRAIDRGKCSMERIWEPLGRADLDYLHGRGLKDETIRYWRLGSLSGGWPRGLEGITLPWFDRDGLVKLEVRRHIGVGSRYVELYRSCPVLYPAMIGLQHSRAIVVEGVFDCVLLWQELGHFPVCTTGSSGEPILPKAVERLAACSKVYIATDADGGGDAVAGRWAGLLPPGRTERVRPPEPYGDWGEMWQGGGDLRAFWRPWLAP